MSDWQQSTVGEVATGFLSGGTPSTSRADYWTGDIPWITSKWLRDKLELTTGEKFVSKEAVENTATKIVPKDSIIFATRVGVGKVGINRIDLAINQDLAGVLIDSENYDITFIAYQLGIDSIQQYVSMNKRGATIKGITRDCLEQIRLNIPPLAEQKRIAHILSTVQRAIEAQERIIQTTTELKKALMHKLFTEGLRNEPQKQTEIGPIPESWDLIRCEDACSTTSVGIVVRPTQYYLPIGVPALRSQNVRVDRMQMEPMVYISEEANDGPVVKSKLRTGDVLIVRTGANLGMSCVLPAELDGCNCIDLLFIRTNPERLNGSFLSRFINSEEAKKQVGAGKTGMAQPHFNVGTVKRIFVPLPPLEDQEVIVSCLEKIDQKHDLAADKKSALQDLFRTLLHELMTAKTRVGELEIMT
jgi:type I restriction enzyme S subunit